MKYLLLSMIMASAVQNAGPGSADMRTITGTVLYNEVEPVVFGTVTAFDEENKLIAGTETDFEGKFNASFNSSNAFLSAVS